MQIRDIPLVLTSELCSGRVYIVVGANVGLGYEAAKHLVSLGSARVIMACRNVTAGQSALATIEAETGKAGIAEVWELDLSSYASVKAFSSRAVSSLSRIDAVIENAAVASTSDMRAEGHPLPVTVNVTGTFLLAVLLLPKLKVDAARLEIQPHIAIVTSGVGFEAKEQWLKVADDPIAKLDKLEIQSEFLYGTSKLFEILAVRHLAPLIPVSKTGVVINLINPGLCKTELARNATPEFRDRLSQMHAQYGRTAEQGSRTLLHGAIAGEASHGCYLDACEINEYVLTSLFFGLKVPDWVDDEEGRKMQKWAWEAVAHELEAVEPGCVARILE
ncbi:hypothetical protein N7510_011336 [Penicillium lagena]|uniref:uncharacterized protein n=1 Tax=Penicillium lagena TaxID=94218 RepID=UPI002541D69A|nr:uncharacterized protein N7510_011336 [Penicillium lagena]KAJ5601802.1 hypothetical protein N7510_011336 [Penicillium lagena]